MVGKSIARSHTRHLFHSMSALPPQVRSDTPVQLGRQSPSSVTTDSSGQGSSVGKSFLAFPSGSSLLRPAGSSFTRISPNQGGQRRGSFSSTPGSYSQAGSYSRSSAGSGDGDAAFLPPRAAVKPIECIDDLLNDIRSDAATSIKNAALGELCNMTSEPSYMEAINEKGAIDVMVSVLDLPPWADQQSIDGALAGINNLVSSPDGREAIAKAGGHGALVKMLQEPQFSSETREIIVQSILQLAFHSETMKVMIAKVLGVEALCNVLSSDVDTIKAKEHAVSALRSMSFAHDSGEGSINLAGRGALTALVGHIMSPRRNKQSTIAAVTVLQNTSVYERNKNFIIQAGGIPTIVSLLQTEHSSLEVVKAGTIVLQNLAVDKGNHQQLLEAGGAKLLIGLLDSPSNSGREEPQDDKGIPTCT